MGSTRNKIETKSIPDGTPVWVNSDFYLKTLELFQRRYGKVLTDDDVVEILRNVDRLFDVLGGKS